MTPSPKYSGLLTDLYELTMAAGYFQTRFEARATFELFVRHLSPRRNYLVAAGLDEWTKEEKEWLDRHPKFKQYAEDMRNALRQNEGKPPESAEQRRERELRKRSQEPPSHN